MLPLETVRKRMKAVCNKEISQSAVAKLAMHLEEYIQEITKVAVKELNEMNKMKTYHGLYAKKRVDAQAIERAIKFFNAQNNTEMPERASGKNGTLESPEVV